ncbi:hypothetical protein [Armatimonas sp.]|uniref:hypothetical protein n=1 Tax=Armatimonas sp. TaxID=1872638 RepID=UPI00286B01E5|nr:hypothetical protein [Armatimonas sp.]
MSLAQWNEPLPEAEREELLESIATQVVKRGLSVPAIIALEMHRPLAFILSQSMIALTPLFGPVVGLNRMQFFGRLLAEPDGVEALIRRIEDKTV